MRRRIDIMEGESSKRFMLHYNFPPFSVGEVGLHARTRTERSWAWSIAERAILPIIPSGRQVPLHHSSGLRHPGIQWFFLYGRVCGGVLSLMDAGVPIKSPVAGVAMGLVKEGDKYAILTDIAGAEDHYGDMDFKVAGTREGITALQMDIKIGGLTMADHD